MVPTDASPLAFLLAVMQDSGQDMATRLHAATAALPYCQARMTATTKPTSTRPQQEAGQVIPEASRFRPSRPQTGWPGLFLCRFGTWAETWVNKRNGPERPVFPSFLAEGAGFEPAGGC